MNISRTTKHPNAIPLVQGDDNRFLCQSYCAHLLLVAQAICMTPLVLDVGW